MVKQFLEGLQIPAAWVFTFVGAVLMGAVSVGIWLGNVQAQLNSFAIEGTPLSRKLANDSVDMQARLKVMENMVKQIAINTGRLDRIEEHLKATDQRVDAMRFHPQ